MHVLVALMDIFDCTADDLLRRVELGVVAATGTDVADENRGSNVLREKNLRPKPARILPPDA